MLRIMTLNLNYMVDKHGPWRERRDLITRAIRESSADIVILQAVKRPGKNLPDQACELAGALDEYPYSFFQAADVLEEGVALGSGFVARIPLAISGSLRLTDRSEDEDPTPRLVLHTELKTGQGPLHLFNCHFSWIPEQTRRNVLETLGYANSVSGPRILIGDFNAPPHSEALGMLYRAGWVDAWEKARPTEDGFTFESDRPSMRIDYILASTELKDAILDVNLIESSQDGVRLSDHLGLAARLRVSGAFNSY
jgi:endonuclease/exonuclease/phosphatase family metal-dependent hydrolase